MAAGGVVGKGSLGIQWAGATPLAWRLMFFEFSSSAENTPSRHVWVAWSWRHAISFKWMSSARVGRAGPDMYWTCTAIFSRESIRLLGSRAMVGLWIWILRKDDLL